MSPPLLLIVLLLGYVLLRKKDDQQPEQRRPTQAQGSPTPSSPRPPSYANNSPTGNLDPAHDGRGLSAAMVSPDCTVDPRGCEALKDARSREGIRTFEQTQNSILSAAGPAGILIGRGLSLLEDKFFVGHGGPSTIPCTADCTPEDQANGICAPPPCVDAPLTTTQLHQRYASKSSSDHVVGAGARK